MAGGCSWTTNWLTFDNSYFTQKRNNVNYLNNNNSINNSSSHHHHHHHQNNNIINNTNNNEIKSVINTPSSNNSSNDIGNTSLINIDNTINKNDILLNSMTPSLLISSSQLLWLPTDQALLDSPEFSIHFKKYKDSLEIFHNDYLKAHLKMSLLGAKLDPPNGFTLYPID